MVAKCCFPVAALKLGLRKVREDSNLPDLSLISGNILEIPTRIIKAMGGVPLAIEQARAMVKKGMPMQDFLGHYETQYQRVMEHKPPKSAWDYEKNLSLISIFNMLLTRLGKDSDAENILAFASCFGPRQIAVNLLCQARQPSGSTKSRRPSQSALEDSPMTWLNYIGHDRLAFQLATSHLESLCLLKTKTDSDGAPVSIALHDSISRWRFETLKSDKRERWIIAAACALGKSLPKDNTGQGAQLRLLPLIRHFHNTIQRFIEPRKLEAPDGELCHQYGRLMAHCAPLYLSSGYPLEAEYVFSQAIEYQRIVEEAPWPKDRQSLLLLKGLAMMMSKNGKMEDAAETTQALHDASTNLFGPSDEITFWAAARLPAVRDGKIRYAEDELRAIVASRGEKLSSATPGHTSGPLSELPYAYPESAFSTLTFTAKQGDIKGIRLMLDRGANVNMRDEKEIDPLQWASNNGHSAVVQMLLGHGADVNSRPGLLGTALHAACSKRHSAIVEILLCNGADVNGPVFAGWTSLFAAAWIGHHTIVQLLLVRCADVNRRGGVLGTALHAASYQGHTEIIETLLINGADVNTDCGCWGAPLHIASKRGHTSVIKILLSHGADVDAMTDWGSPLYYAARNGHYSTVQLLLKNGADVNARSKKSRTALQIAKSQGHSAVVDLLKAAGAREDI